MCAEPYMKLSDAAKSIQRITQQVPLLCSRLGHYHMPFAWAARSHCCLNSILQCALYFYMYIRTPVVYTVHIWCSKVYMYICITV